MARRAKIATAIESALLEILVTGRIPSGLVTSTESLAVALRGAGPVGPAMTAWLPHVRLRARMFRESAKWAPIIGAVLLESEVTQ